MSEANIAVTAGWVTVSGLDFGFVDATPTGGLGLTSCVTSTWASMTSTVCRAAPGTAPLSDVLVTTATIVGTQTSAFSYDGMRLVPWQLGAAGFRFMSCQSDAPLFTSAGGELCKREQRRNQCRVEHDPVRTRLRVV